MEREYVSLAALAEAIEARSHDLISTDLFDTVLLRDHTIESARLAIACQRVAPILGIDAAVLTRLRWDFHDNAYRAVLIERPGGEASLSAICRTIAEALGLGADEAQILQRTEVDVDIEHLNPNRPLLNLIDAATRSGIRVIGVSDTYYDGADLRRILQAVVGAHSIAVVYSSSDLGATKHAGGIFDQVARLENVSPSRILHVGDSPSADVEMSQAAFWTSVHLPRVRSHRVTKLVGKVLALPVKMRRVR